MKIYNYQLIILTFGLILISKTTFSQQQIIQPNASWMYFIADPAGNKSNFYKKYSNIGDSLVNNVLHHVIEESYFMQDSIDGDSLIYSYDFLVHQIENKLISNQYNPFCFPIQFEEVFYNMDAEIGDTLGSIQDFNSTLTYVLSKKDSVQLSGQNLRRNIIDVFCDNEELNKVHMVEKIGTVSWGNDFFGNWKEYPFCIGWDNCSADIFIFHSYEDDEIKVNNYYPYAPGINLERIGESVSCTEDSLIITFSASDPINDISSFSWHFPNGIPEYSTDSIVTVMFNDLPSGFNEFYLQTSNIYGISLDTFQTIVIEQPFADFNYSAINNVYEFINLTSYENLKPEYEWDFGDNNFSKEENPTHTYLPGTYNVTLKAYYQNELCDTSQYNSQVSISTSNTNSIARQPKFTVTPNPNQGIFTIVSEHVIEDIKIINPLGQIVNFKYTKYANKTRININERGLILVRLKINNDWNIQKVISL